MSSERLAGETRDRAIDPHVPEAMKRGDLRTRRRIGRGGFVHEGDDFVAVAPIVHSGYPGLIRGRGQGDGGK